MRIIRLIEISNEEFFVPDHQDSNYKMVKFQEEKTLEIFERRLYSEDYHIIRKAKERQTLFSAKILDLEVEKVLILDCETEKHAVACAKKPFNIHKISYTVLDYH